MCELKTKIKFQGKVFSDQVETHTRYRENVLAPLRRQQVVSARACGKSVGVGYSRKREEKTMMKRKFSRDKGAPVARAKGDRMTVERWAGF